MKNKLKILFISFLCILLIVAGSVGIYASRAYRAEDSVSIAAEQGITVNTTATGDIVFVPEHVKTGLIFYPGGNVQYTSYVPLLQQLADKGVLCVLVKMPLNLAVLDIDAADGIIAAYPEVDSWYIGGHSLGGAMACSYLEKNADDFDGVILLAAYSTADLNALDINAVSIYGSADGVLNIQKYNECKSNLPKNLNELVIDGGCHSFFGNYGMQKGDGTPLITRDEQQAATVDYILSVID